MSFITIEQKTDFHNTMINMNFNYNNFYVRDNPEESYIEYRWLGDFRYYTFKTYYPREYRSGHIFIDVRRGGKKNEKIEIELPNLQGKFAQWLTDINKQINYDEITKTKAIKFSEFINSISPKFVVIYIQALSADTQSLNELSGMGFRKAFEFILIDYLLHEKLLKSEDEAKKITTLKAFIDLLQDELIIYKLLSYTSWVGNEFCHYFRKWESKEVKDLIAMINIFIEWIDTKEKLKLVETKSKIINSTFDKNGRK